MRNKKIETEGCGPGALPFSVEGLEGREMCSATPWSAQDKAVGLDLATQNFPNITGAGETIAIIDRGVDYNHPDLGGGMGKTIIASWDFQDNTGDVFPYDGDAHGTGTSGQIAAAPHVVNGELYQGVATGVKIVALKTNGAADIKAAFDWILKYRKQYNIVAVNYVDMSGGWMSSYVPEMQELDADGVFMAGAVGNYGPSNAPASDGLLHRVGSVDPDGQLSSFTPRGAGVELVAPGGNVNIDWYYSGVHANLNSNGTSWAGPQVTATAALVKQVDPNFTNAQILSIMQDSGTPLWDSLSQMTYKELNVNAAIGLAYQRSAAVVAPKPVVPPVVVPTPKKPTPTPAPPVVVPTPTPPSRLPVQPPARTTPTPVAVPPTVAPPKVTPPAPLVTHSYLGTPFTGVEASTGESVDAANFDRGNAGVTYQLHPLFNTKGDLYRPGTVDMTRTKTGHGGWAVGYTQVGEWLNYTMNVSATGAYNVSARVAANVAGSQFHFEVDGVNVTGKMTVPDTHDWNRYTTLTHGPVSLAAGKHVVKLYIDTAGNRGFAANFDSFEFSAVSTAHHRRHPHHRAPHSPRFLEAKPAPQAVRRAA